jgi:hypothetical protein
MGFFTPNKNYYDELQNERFELFLISDGATKEGQDRIADHYLVGKLRLEMDKKIVLIKDTSICWY